MDLTWAFLSASLLLAPAPAPARTAVIPACGVELHLRAKAAVMEVAHQEVDPRTAFDVELVNSSDRPATLVMPGDGSGDAWRTPIIEWSVSPKPQPVQLLRCGNINSLRAHEVFTLAPGERRQLRDWLPQVYGITSGTYTFRLSYTNDPTLEWKGLSLGAHDAATMQRVRESTACRIVSNDVQIAVVSKPR
jgi:hypothetical protein